MNPAVVAALISAGSGIIQNIASIRTNNRSFAQTKQLYGMQQADRDAQNAYSSPASSIARLKAAGLSPASFYGNTTAAGPSVGSVAPGSADVFTPDIAGAIGSGASAASTALLVGSQRKNLDSASEKNSADALKALSESAMTDFERKLAEDLRTNTIARAQADLDRTIQETATSKAQEVLSQVETDYRRVGMYLTREQVRYTAKQIEVMDKELVKMGFEMRELDSRTELNKANTALAQETARQITETIDKVMPAMIADYAASVNLKSAQSWSAQTTADFQKWYNDNVSQYLPEEIQAKIRNMDKQTKTMAIRNTQSWMRLPGELVRDAMPGFDAISGLFGTATKIGF